MKKKFADKRNLRIEHIASHLTVDRSMAIANIVHGRGSFSGSASALQSDAAGRALYAWFDRRDLHGTKQWAYVSAMLLKRVYQDRSAVVDSCFTYGPGGKMLELRMALLSDNEALIDWFADFDAAYDQKRIENHRIADFRAYQAIVALRGDWPRLIKRTQTLLNDPFGARDERKYVIDHRFFLALAHGDITGMQNALACLLTPQALAKRRNDESGFTLDLISSYAFIYAKIAWRHGYEVMVESPLLPSEWLPVAPLGYYDNHYSFLSERTHPNMIQKAKLWMMQLTGRR